MRLREPEMPLDPEVERELAAIEAGLAGLEGEPELVDLAELARLARGLGGTPEQGFAARPGERAAAGFARRGKLERRRSAARPGRDPERRTAGAGRREGPGRGGGYRRFTRAATGYAWDSRVRRVLVPRTETGSRKAHS